MSIPIFFTAFNINIFSSADIGENRALASKNILQDVSISDYPKQIEKYLNDNMVFRTQIIRIYHYIFAWHLYSPVADYIRIHDEIYSKSLIIRYLDTPNLSSYIRESLNGMNYIAKYYDCRFVYVIVPDKITTWENHLKNWMIKFKKRHYNPSYYKQNFESISNDNFFYTDLLKIFNQSSANIFSKRYDFNHYNINGLDLSINEIVKYIDNTNGKHFNFSAFKQAYYMGTKTIDTYPHIGTYKNEVIPIIFPYDKIPKGIHHSNNPYAIDIKTQWQRTDYIVNQNNIDGINLLFAADSSFRALNGNGNIIIKGANGQVTPIIYGVNKYIHTHNITSFNYTYLVNNMTFINADAFVYAITERMLSGFPKDHIFQIVGRYALSKNENFIFPENLIFNSEEISSADIEINKNNKYININKQLMTDKNGEIYISFRYKSPAKTTALLEYSTNKDFTNIKKVSTQLRGGVFRRC